MIGWFYFFFLFFFFKYSTMGTTVIDLRRFVSAWKMQNSTHATRCEQWLAVVIQQEQADIWLS